MKAFLKTSLAFTAGLVCVLFAVDQFLGWQLALLHGKTCVGPEVYVSVHHAAEPSSAVRAIYLGDSVAHQLFKPGDEPRPQDRYLACNQAISLAGQYYLLANALAHCPNVRDAYLFYYPGSFENDLGPPLSNDYFCGFFHSPKEIRDVFATTHDVRLLAVQIGRLLLPHVMQRNSLNRPMVQWSAALAGGAQNAGPAGMGPEPILTVLNKLTGGERVAAAPPPLDALGRRPVTLSTVSQLYLAKMRDLCRARGVILHVIPCPCSDAIRWAGADRVYDRPIFYQPREHFYDGVHLFGRFLAPVRRHLLALDGLDSRSRQVSRGR